MLKWFGLSFLVLLISCSDPISSADLEAAEIKFEGTVTPQWGDFYDIEVRLSPYKNEYDYVLLNKNDSLYIQVDSNKKKLVNQGSTYNTQVSLNPGVPLDLVLYLGETDQTLISKVEVPKRINSTLLDISIIDYQAKYFWTPESSDRFEVNWFMRCSNDSLSLSKSDNSTVDETLGVASWDIDEFLSKSAWNDGANCELSVKATRTLFGEIDFNFAGGDFISKQTDERKVTFTK